MKLRDAYNLHTNEAKAEIRRDLAALLGVRGHKVKDSYLNQVLLDLRPHPVSDDIAKIISDFFIKTRGLKVEPLEARGCQPVKIKRRKAVMEKPTANDASV